MRTSVLNPWLVIHDMAREIVPVFTRRFGSFLDMFSGNFSRRFLVRTLIPLMYLCLFACLLIAGLLFPQSPQGGLGYIPFARTISELGNRAENPGAWFFTIGIAITTVFMIPYACYTWRRLFPINKAAAGFILFLTLAGAVGFAMVGIWDEDSHQIHDIVSAIAFLGTLFAVLFALLPMIADKRRTGQDRFGIKWQLIHIVTFIVMIVVGLILNKDPAVPDFFREYAFWEWLVFAGLVVYYVSLAIRLPDEAGKKEVIS
jgi:hypothetical protein